MAKRRVGAVNVVSDVFLASRRAQIVTLASQQCASRVRDCRWPDELRRRPQGANSRGRKLRRPHLKGEKPSDLPVQQATRVQFAINMKTVKSLGPRFPLSVLARANCDFVAGRSLIALGRAKAGSFTPPRKARLPP
jgi:hypothetical protein